LTEAQQTFVALIDWASRNLQTRIHYAWKCDSCKRTLHGDDRKTLSYRVARHAIVHPQPWQEPVK
jgi:hypothetical protein